MDAQQTSTVSEEILGINFDMGLKNALTEVVQQFVVAGKLPQYCTLRISMTANIDETFVISTTWMLSTPCTRPLKST